MSGGRDALGSGKMRTPCLKWPQLVPCSFSLSIAKTIPFHSQYLILDVKKTEWFFFLSLYCCFNPPLLRRALWLPLTREGACPGSAHRKAHRTTFPCTVWARGQLRGTWGRNLPGKSSFTIRTAEIMALDVSRGHLSQVQPSRRSYGSKFTA